MSVRPPALRPLELGERLDFSFRLWWKNFGTLFAAALGIAVVIGVLGTLISASTDPNAFRPGLLTADKDELEDPDVGTQMAGLLANIALNYIGTGFAAAAVAKVVLSAYTGAVLDIRGAVRFALRKTAPVVAALVLTFLATLAGFTLLIVPGIWLFVALSFAAPALLMENLGVREAVARSYELVKGRWWPTFGSLLVMSLILVLIGLPISFVLLLTQQFANSELTIAVVATLAGALGYAVTLPLGGVMVAVLYFDLRVRKEGYDLQLQAQTIGRPLPAEQPWAGPGNWPAPPPDQQPWGQPSPFGRPPAADEPHYGGFAAPRPPEREHDS